MLIILLFPKPAQSLEIRDVHTFSIVSHRHVLSICWFQLVYTLTLTFETYI